MKFSLKDNNYMIVSGEALIYIFKNKELSHRFFKLGILCRSVICCRVSAKQKSQVVRLVKSMGNWITLSVGDGTNDVPMIMEANIGVGIQGVEGTQAVRSADYGICQFKFLQRLILVHGRNGYRRISNFICYYFYKNIILVFAEIAFVYFSGFSGQPFFPDFLPVLYNSLWTSWPCIFAYSIECDLIEKNENENKNNNNNNNNNNNDNNKNKEKLNEKNNLLGKYFEVIPKLYEGGQKRVYFNLRIFWLWLLYAIIHGGLSYYLIITGVRFNSITGQGRLIDHWFTDTIIFSCIIHIVTYKIFVEINYWNWLNLGASILSIAVYYLSIILIGYPPISKIVQNSLTNKIYYMLFSKAFWIYIITLPLIVLVFDLSLKFIYKFIYPSPVDLVNEYYIVPNDTENLIRRVTKLKEKIIIFTRDSIFGNKIQQKNNKQNIELNSKIENFENQQKNKKKEKLLEIKNNIFKEFENDNQNIIES
jgi:phospholipid-transporting ATPase